MKKLYKFSSYALLLFSILCSAHSLRAMENPADDDLSYINATLYEALESLLMTSALNAEEKAQLDQLVNTVKYSNVPMMTEDDLKRFLKNYNRLMRESDEGRAWYLKHLHPYLDEDVVFIKVEKTWFEKMQTYISYLQYFQTKIYPCIVIPFVEYCFYDTLRSAWEKGEDGNKIIAQWLQMHTLAYMMYFPREPIDRFVGQFGIMTMPLRQLSYEQLQGLGHLYNEAFKKMLGWFY